MKALAWRAGLVSAAGFTLLALIGAAGRAPSTYPNVSMPERDEKNLRAYAQPVLAVYQWPNQPRDKDVRKALDVWLDHYNRGLLFSVAPAHLDDLGEKGARGEILRSRKTLSSRVQSVASKLESSNPAAAAVWYRDLLVLNDAFKFSGPESMTDSAYYQHAAIKGLERTSAKLNEAQRAEIRTALDSMVRPSQPLGPFTLRINAAYRRATEESADGGVIISGALHELSATTPEIVEAKGAKFTAVATHEEMLKNISTSMYMSLRAEQRIREEAIHLSKALSPAVR